MEGANESTELRRHPKRDLTICSLKLGSKRFTISIPGRSKRRPNLSDTFARPIRRACAGPGTTTNTTAASDGRQAYDDHNVA